MDSASASRDRLTVLERIALAIPLAGGAVFGLAPLLAPGPFAAITGYAGDDPLIGAYAGAATFGYAVALALGIGGGRATPLRLVVAAVLAFNLASLYACGAELAAGRQRPVVLLIFATSVLLVAISWWFLARHGASVARDVASWVVGVIAILTVAAAFFGLFPLLAPESFARFFALNGTDVFLFRQAGAATLGYAVMGVLEVRSQAWDELRLANIMAFVFNAIAFIASVADWLAGLGDRHAATWLELAVGPASLFAAAATALILARRGR